MPTGRGPSEYGRKRSLMSSPILHWARQPASACRSAGALTGVVVAPCGGQDQLQKGARQCHREL
jgi:hypothetical protein